MEGQTIITSLEPDELKAMVKAIRNMSYGKKIKKNQIVS